MALFYIAESSLDASRVRDSRDQFERLASATEDVTIDMAEVEFIDTSGVGALVFVWKRVRAAGRNLHLINTKGQPQQLLLEIGLVADAA